MNSRRTRLPGAILIAATLLPANSLPAAGPGQEHTQITLAAEHFLQREAAGLPGVVRIEVSAIDRRLSLAYCAHLEAFFPPGSRAWGRTTVGVRCAAPSAWTIYLPANVRVSGAYLMVARPLAPGQTIAADDFSVQAADLAQLPAGVLTDASQALGRQLVSGLRAGQPLHRDALREQPAVVQGQLVSLIANGPGFSISSQGHAMGKAPEGGRVRVKTLSGTIVSGILRAGLVVEVNR